MSLQVCCMTRICKQECFGVGVCEPGGKAIGSKPFQIFWKPCQLAKIEGEISMVYPYLLVQAAKSYFHAGKPEEAQTYLDQGLQLALSRQYRQLPAIGERLQGRIWQAKGIFEDAQPCFERSLADLLAIDDAVEHARTEEAYGLFYIARDEGGDMERGQILLKSAQATFKRLGVNG